MKRPQKRFPNEAAIVAAIDAVHQRIADKKKEIEALNKAINEKRTVYKLLSESKSVEVRAEAMANLIEAQEQEQQVVRINKAIKRLEETKLPHLGQVLSEFRTQPMSFLEDPSVVR